VQREKGKENRRSIFVPSRFILFVAADPTGKRGGEKRKGWKRRAAEYIALHLLAHHEIVGKKKRGEKPGVMTRNDRRADSWQEASRSGIKKKKQEGRRGEDNSISPPVHRPHERGREGKGQKEEGKKKEKGEESCVLLQSRRKKSGGKGEERRRFRAPTSNRASTTST